MVPLGTPLPHFDLPDVRTGLHVRTKDFTGRAVLVMFLCNHCPFVMHVRDEVARLGREHSTGGLAVVGISSNDPISYPEDAPERMAEEARSAQYCFPYCFDATQQVARDFKAACTPDFFLYDTHHLLAYRGCLDRSRPGSAIPVTGHELKMAIAAVLAGAPASTDQHPSIGCSIKWRGG